MATLQLRVRYRPLKIGFLVPWGDLPSLVKATRINTLLWGGIRNPILPIGRDEGFTEQLLTLFNADVLFPVSEAPEVTAFVSKYPYLATTGHIAENIFFEDWHTKKQNIAVLDVLHIIDYYWQTELRHRPADFRSSFSLVEWAEADPCASCLDIWLGSYPTDRNLSNDFRRAFERGLKAQIFRIEPTAPAPGALGETVSVLGLTEQRLTSIGWSRFDAGLYLGGATDFEDLLNFWNLRAAGIALEYLPLDHPDRFTDCAQTWLSRLDSLPGRFRDDVGSIGFYSKEATLGQAREVSNRFTLTKRRRHVTHSATLWNGLNVVPARTSLSSENVLADVDRSYGRYTVSFSLPDKPISDKDSERDIGSQHLVAVVDPLVEFAYPDHTLKPPFLRHLNEFLSRQIAFDPWKLRVDRDGLALIQRLYESAETLYPISARDLIIKLFDLAGIKAKMSAPGLIADKIIHGLRESDPLEACRVFKIRGVRKLLKEIRVGQTITWDQALSTIGKAEFKKFKGLFIEPRSTSELRPQDVVRHLLEKRILCPHLRGWPRVLRRRRGFGCRSCGLKSKLLYREFEGSWTCPFCMETQRLTPLVPDEFKDEMSAWAFRRCGFFAKDNNQEGALPVLLALMQLKRVLDSAEFSYTTALSLQPPGLPCETDLVVLHHGRHDEIEIGIGECKDEGGLIDRGDINNLSAAAKQLAEAHGVKTFLIFAKTADRFQPEELALFKELASNDAAPVLMTNNELEPYYPYEHVKGTKIPTEHPFSLEDMARNSQFIYLT